VADAHLISLRTPFVGISVPGKLYGIMASARPALFVGPTACESAETIVEARCGAVIDPALGEAGQRLAEWIRRLEAVRVPCGIVKTVPEAISDSISASPVFGMPSSVGGEFRLPPPRLDEHGASIRRRGWGVFSDTL
jgi:hypothetical protein